MVECCCVVRSVGFDHICWAEVFCCACGVPDNEGNSLSSPMFSWSPSRREIRGAASRRQRDLFWALRPIMLGRLTQDSMMYGIGSRLLFARSSRAHRHLFGVVRSRVPGPRPWVHQMPTVNCLLVRTMQSAMCSSQCPQVAYCICGDSAPSFPFCSLLPPNGPPRAAFCWF